MNNIIESLRHAIHYFKSLKKICDNEIQSLPKGNLTVIDRNGFQYYYKKVSGKRHYIGNKTKEVERLISRYFFEKFSATLAHNTEQCEKVMESLIPTDLGSLISSFPKAYSDIPDYCYKKLGFLPPGAVNINKSNNPFHLEALVHSSASGIMMRSKSEVLIGNYYDSIGCSYAYEMELRFPNGDRLYPDFTVRSNDGTKLLFHEHCGMMNDHEYRKHFFYKLDKYIKFNYIPFRDVLFTFDESDGSIDMEAIGKMIQYFLEQ